MIEIKPIIAALVCFFTQEPFPVISEITLLNIDFANNEITIEHENLITVAGYEAQAELALTKINGFNSLDDSMGDISLVSKEIYEKDGVLNASLKLKFKKIKDLEIIGFSMNKEGKLSYYKMDDIELLNENGIETENKFIFDVDESIFFKSISKFKGSFEKVSLLATWKKVDNQ